MTREEYIGYLKANITVTASYKLTREVRFRTFTLGPYTVSTTNKDGRLYYFGTHNWLEAPPMLQEAFRELVSEYARCDWGIQAETPIEGALKERGERGNGKEDRKKSFFERLFR